MIGKKMVCDFYRWSHSTLLGLFDEWQIWSKKCVSRFLQNDWKSITTKKKKKINLFHSDNGKVYFNEYLGKFLKEKGILHHSTYRDTPQQNSIAEKKNKHVLEVARAIMFSMHVPKYLRGDAILTTSYLINRMSTRVLQYVTPLDYFKETFLECRINLDLPLKNFGCTVFVHIPSKF